MVILVKCGFLVTKIPHLFGNLGIISIDLRRNCIQLFSRFVKASVHVIQSAAVVLTHSKTMLYKVTLW